MQSARKMNRDSNKKTIRKPIGSAKIGNRNKKKTLKHQGGGLFGTSYDGKIIKHLTQLKVINQEQGKQIVTFANKGNIKKDKIALFVDQCVAILLANLYNIWKQLPGDVRKKTEFKELSILLDKQLPEQKDSLYIALHGIHKEYGILAKPTKDLLNTELDKIKSNNGVVGKELLPILYNLNEKWVKTETLKTLPEPKYADLYEKWFDIAHKGWADRHKWLLLFS